MTGRIGAIIKKIILSAVSGTGLTGLAVTFWKPIYRGIDMLGNIDADAPQVTGQHMFDHMFKWEGKSVPTGDASSLFE
jgi:hypothetical protein